MGKHRKFSPGDTVESLELIENLGYRQYCGQNTTYWQCKCLKCGNIIDVPLCNLGKAQKDCGCWRKEIRINLVGKRFGRLTVISLDEERNKKTKNHIYYICQCDCGNIKSIRSTSLRDGSVVSCGCFHDDLFRKSIRKAHEKNFIGGTNKSHIEHYGELTKSNTSGISGVSWRKDVKKWVARVTYRNKTYSLGYYDDKEKAGEVVQLAREKIKKDFRIWYEEEYIGKEKKDE